MIGFSPQKSKVKTGIVAVLDIGSSKITCAIADLRKSGPADIIGLGRHASAGIRSGVIVDMHQAESSIAHAVNQAEKMAGITLKRVYVSTNGSHVTSRRFRGQVDVSRHSIDESDIKYVLQEACSGALSDPQHQMLHVLPLGYNIDDIKGIADPRGMFGTTLRSIVHVICARQGPLSNLMTCISRCHLDVAGIVASSYASGLSSLVEDEKTLGVTLIEMGAGTTSYVAFHNGQAIHTGCIPLGGQHVTSDIARGLSTPMAHAERLKTMYGTALVSSAESHDIMMVPQMGEHGGDSINQMSRMALVSIIKPRLEEILDHVQRGLAEADLNAYFGKRVVLTGGASQIAGLRELTSIVLSKHVRLGKPLNISPCEVSSDPAFSSCAGVFAHLQGDLQAAPEQQRAASSTGKLAGIIKRLW